MTDSKTKISDRAQIATDHYIANMILKPVEGYTWSRAMIEANYSKSYTDANSKRVWDYVGVQSQIAAVRAKKQLEVKLDAKAILNRLMLIAGVKEATDADKVLSRTASDQNKALDLLGKHLKLWDRQGETTTEQEIDLTAAQQQEAEQFIAFKRAQAEAKSRTELKLKRG
jgi:hypothetical protein